MGLLSQTSSRGAAPPQGILLLLPPSDDLQKERAPETRLGRELGGCGDPRGSSSSSSRREGWWLSGRQRPLLAASKPSLQLPRTLLRRVQDTRTNWGPRSVCAKATWLPPGAPGTSWLGWKAVPWEEADVGTKELEVQPAPCCGGSGRRDEGDWTTLRPCPRGWCVSSTMRACEGARVSPAWKLP